MHSRIRPHGYAALTLPSDVTKIQQIVPNTTVSLGKYGSFSANQIIGRPYYVTFEILDQPDEKDGHVLRAVSAAELHTEALIEDASTPGETEQGEEPGAVEELKEAEDGNVSETMRTNQHIVDDSSTQRMTMDEIEALKKTTTGAGKEIITRLLQSHAALEQKTAFSRAKYTLRKRKKYLKRFTVLPVTPSLLTNWLLEKGDAGRMLELRDEMIGLIGCWANVHYCEGQQQSQIDIGGMPRPDGRWLVVDDTGGLLVAAMAERMGILYPPSEDDSADEQPQPPELETAEAAPTRSRERVPGMSATHSALTVIHNNIQPNLSFLKYFAFDIQDPDESHPLHTHLKTLTWMQLLDPESDSVYSREPPVVPEDTLAGWKPPKRGTYYKKRRRYERVRRVVDETRAGGFDGLVVVSLLDPVSILKHTVPLLGGSAPVVVYSPHVEPLVRLSDMYSTARRAAYLQWKQDRQSSSRRSSPGAEPKQPRGQAESNEEDESDDFPVDPTLLLATTLQTSRVRQWQVLPGRTHPLMTSRGGAEGYVFHATRSIPAEGKVAARGQPGRKKRKLEGADTGGDAGTPA